MRENQFLGVLALILALGMPLSFELFACITILAEGKIFDAKIRTETELLSAIKDSSILSITLQNDIVMTHSLEISRDLILDLGGFNLTSLKANLCVVDIKYGNVLLTGKGSVVAYGLKGTAIRIKGATTSDNENYATILIDEKIKLFAPNYYGLLVAPNFKAAYGVTVDFRGSMIAQDGFCISNSIRGRGKNIPLIKIADQTRITVDENSGVALHAAGYGRWEIGASEITGATGIVAQSGNLTLNGTKIIATGAFVEPESSDDKLTLLGAVLQSGKAANSDHAVEITVNGGEYTSLRSYIFAETRHQKSKPALQMLVIEDGEFAGKLGTFSGLAPRGSEHAVTVVYGGNFTENVQDYISSSCHINKVPGEGIYHVIEDKVAEEIDEATRLARAEGQLQALIEESLVYTHDYISGDLGKWKSVATKAIASIKRAITLGKKALKQRLDYDRIVSAEQSLQRALDNFELVSDAMRTELAESIASVNAIDPEDYTKYSYQQLATVAAAAEELLQHDDVLLQDIYSAILDVEINIDLLDGVDEVEDEEIDEFLESSDLVATDSNPEPQLAPPPKSHPQLSNTERTALLELLVSILLTQSQAVFVSSEAPVSTPSAVTAPQPQDRSNATVYQPLPSSIPATEGPQSAKEASASSITTSPAPTPSLENDAAYILSHSIEYPAEAALLEAKGNLYSMLEAVQDLTVNDYEIEFAEQFGELQVAIVKARAILYKPNTNFVELMAAMDGLAEKTTGLKGLTEINTAAEAPQSVSEPAVATFDTTSVAEVPSAPEPTAIAQPVAVDWTGLSEVVAEISQLDPDNFTATSYARVLSELELAKSMLANSQATQSAVEDLVFELNLALLALEYVPPATEPSTIPTNSEPAPAYTPTVAEADPTVTPNWLMSMLAGAYAGMATYRRSRLIAKRQKHSAV